MDDVKTLEKVKQLRPIDDALFEKLMESKEVCQEVLRVIINDEQLTVISVTPQRSIKNLIGRSVRLDALCQLSDGTHCNIEVQKTDNDDHVRRARYNASAITATKSSIGTKFVDVPNVMIVFITKFDVFQLGRNIYHVESIIQETGMEVDDGLHEIFVNTAVKDGSTLSELMDCFMQQNVNNPKFPALSQEMHYYKYDEKGVHIMCEVIEEYANEQVLMTQANNVNLLVANPKLSLTLEEACEMLKISLDEYHKGQELLKEELLSMNAS